MILRLVYLSIMLMSLNVFSQVKKSQSKIHPYSSWLYSRESGQGLDKRDVLWPFMSYRRYDEYERYRFLNIISIDENKADVKSDYHFSVLPFWFSGRVDGEKYRGLFPLRGTIRDMMGYDYLRFTLFPLFLQTQRAGRAVKTSYFWPLINFYKSPTESQWSLFPLFGRTQVENKHHSYFALWPFASWGKSLNVKKPGEWFLFWPFYGYIDNSETVSHTALWPFFLVKYSKNHIRVNFPFPFFSYASSRGKDGKLTSRKVNFWPFYLSYKSNRVNKKTFLWPVINYEKSHIGNIVHFNYSLFPLFWRKRDYIEGRAIRDFWRLWPLFEKDGQRGNNRYRFPALWVANNNSVIERNFSRILNLYERNVEEDGSYKTKMFWGIWRRSEQVKKMTSSWSFLWGFLGSEKQKDTGRNYKFLWINF